MHFPRRDDDVAKWLRNKRQKNVDDRKIWHMLDNILDEYRFTADCGYSLLAEIPESEERYM